MAAKPYMIVGNDEKLNWDENGKPVLSPSGRDSVLIVDLEDPENPKIAANLPLKNSVVGPPVNLAINPSGTLALVADSVDVVKDGDALKQVPDTKLYVIDLEASPPKLLKTLEVGKQPSGLDISHDGTMALVALRAENAVGVLSINGKNVELTQKVPVDELVSHVEFTPNGKTAIASKFVNHKVALLSIESNKKVSYNKQDLPVGLWPYNVSVSPDGKIALTADNGFAGASDGNVDTVSVVDLEATPPRVIDKVVVGDGPEGLAISPKGDVAVAVIINGSNSGKKDFFYHKNGTLTVMKIDGKTVTKIKEGLETGGLPEAAVFTPDGRYLLVGNFLDQDFSIYRVDGSNVTDTGKRFKVPGHPASARMGR
ncbi:YncE family protein [Methylobacterium sp. CB376]|uniref:YncE family protein n=1 Tax=unclassified Methylobacterium TaxID=2615210 RepID=UPI0022400211|nr:MULTISPECIES: YncE family protein [Methylobacterium]WFT79370.1 YncE family protein [Methylobacterium nodulans]